MKAEPARFTTTSYALLVFIDRLGEAAPYDIKKALQRSLFDFWPLPHTTTYEESARLSEAGYLKVRQAAGGRRRRGYALTPAGRCRIAPRPPGGPAFHLASRRHLAIPFQPIPDRRRMKVRTDEELRRRAIFQLARKRCFAIHARAYLVVNVVLIGIWALTGGLFWPLFPILGWGIGLSAHAWATYGHWKPFSEEQIRREAERLQKGA